MKTFSDLKINDEVIVISRNGKRIVRIERKTKTQIITSDKNKYRISDGKEIAANKWNSSHLRLASCSELQEQKEKEYMLELIRQLHNFKGYGKFSIEKLKKIFTVIGLELPLKKSKITEE